MRLSWNEMRARAAAFAAEWRDAAYEKGETQSFYNEFFGVRRRTVAATKSTSSGSTIPPATLTCSGPACCWSNRRAPAAA